MKYRFLIFITPLLLNACTTGQVADKNFSYRKIPEGSTLILKRTIVVPANAFGAVVNRAGSPGPQFNRDEKDTFCVLEVDKKHPRNRLIKPTEFRVVRTNYKVDYALHKRRQVAQGGSTQPVAETHITILYLQSQSNPEVRDIQCQTIADYGAGLPISIELFRWAVGGDFDLVVANN